MKPMPSVRESRELPFDYHKARRALLHGSRMADDCDFEDRYHDCLEKFLRKWNGVGDPVGALFLYFKQWYRDKDYRKKLVFTTLEYQDDEDEVLQHDVPTLDDSHWLLLNDDVQRSLNTCTDRQLEILALRMDDVEFRVIAERYGVSHQAVMDSYRKLTRKILGVLQ